MSFSTQDYEMAYLAAFTAIGVVPGEDLTRRLALATPSPTVLLEVVVAIRKAAPAGISAISRRTAAAFEALSKYPKTGGPS